MNSAEREKPVQDYVSLMVAAFKAGDYDEAKRQNANITRIHEYKIMTKIVKAKSAIEVYINGDGSVCLLQTPPTGEDQIITIELVDADLVADAIKELAYLGGRLKSHE